jgi:protein-disulfide isomerase
MIVRRAFLALLIICIGCSAQGPPASTAQSSASAPTPDLVQLLERHVRAQYQLPPDVKIIVGPLRASDFAGYDALTIVFDTPEHKKAYEFLLSQDHKTLLRVTKLDLTKDPYTEIMKKIDTTGRPARGNKDAKIVVVNYDDFECPFCSHMHATLFPEIFKDYGDRVLFIYKDYPLEEIHPWAIHAAVDANCLNAQSADAYWDYADYMHSEQNSVRNIKERQAQYAELDKLALVNGQKHNLNESQLQACIKAQDDKAVRASMREGDGIGVEATPTLFVNGAKVDGAVPAEQVRAALDRALKDAGMAPPEHKPASDAKTGATAPSR